MRPFVKARGISPQSKNVFKGSDFLKEVGARIPLFLKAKATDQDGNEADIWGPRALQALQQFVIEKSHADADVGTSLSPIVLLERIAYLNSAATMLMVARVKASIQENIRASATIGGGRPRYVGAVADAPAPKRARMTGKQNAKAKAAAAAAAAADDW